MRLEYSILAIDDQPETAATTQEFITGFLEREGFDLSWRTVSDAGALEGFLKEAAPRPDLVIVDNKLGSEFQDLDGPHWAERIRSAFRFTDIMFYGQSPAKDLRNAIASEAVDGVYCSSRSELREDLRELVSVHIEQWTDAPAMRGLAVGVAAELDDLLREACIGLASRQDKEWRKKVYEWVTTRVAKQSGKRPEEIRKPIDADDVEELFRHLHFGAYELAQTIRTFSSLLPGADKKAGDAFFLRYSKDIIEPRNILAHGRYDAKEQEFRTSKASFPLTPERCRAFRVALRLYRGEMRTLRDAALQGTLSFTLLDDEMK